MIDTKSNSVLFLHLIPLPPTSFLSFFLSFFLSPSPSISLSLFPPPTQWENHTVSLKLEEKTRQKILEHIESKVSAGEGTWIDWQYLLDAAKLLQRVCVCVCVCPLSRYLHIVLHAFELYIHNSFIL